MSTAASGTSSGDPVAPRQQGGRVPVRTVLIATGAVALALRLWVLFLPGLLSVTQYDDGPYFGSAVRLVDGVLPYRDYAFVQPPGITLLMSPAALESHLGGTAWALVAGRFLTVFASAAAVLLAGLLVRHRGILAVLLACGIMTIYPPAVRSAHTVLLEPWLVLFCLAGAVAVFDGDRITASARRLAWGGVAFGFAGAIKVWAIVPVLVIAVLCLPRARRAAVFAAGVAGGFGIPVLPFAFAAPRRFYDDVVVAQLARVGMRWPTWRRFDSMLGTPHTLGEAPVLAIAVVVAALLTAVQVAASLAERRLPPALEWFAIASAVLIVAMFLWPPYYADHYAAFLAPFLALCVALPVSRLAAAVRARRAARRQAAPDDGTRRRAGHWAARPGLILLGLAVLAAAVAQAPPPTRWTARLATPAVTLRLVPGGSCVLTDSASYLLIADRFTSKVPGCTQMVDSLGTDLAAGQGRRPGAGAGQDPAVTAAWLTAFRTAGWVLLTPKNALRIPWNRTLRAYFQAHFRPVRALPSYDLYARYGISPLSGPADT